METYWEVKIQKNCYDVLGITVSDIFRIGFANLTFLLRIDFSVQLTVQVLDNSIKDE